MLLTFSKCQLNSIDSIFFIPTPLWKYFPFFPPALLPAVIRLLSDPAHWLHHPSLGCAGGRRDSVAVQSSGALGQGENTGCLPRWADQLSAAPCAAGEDVTWGCHAGGRQRDMEGAQTRKAARAADGRSTRHTQGHTVYCKRTIEHTATFLFRARSLESRHAKVVHTHTGSSKPRNFQKVLFNQDKLRECAQ